MIASALVLLLVAGPSERMLAEADALAARARSAPPERKAARVEEALRAYASILAARPKDRELVPRVRRRRARLLVHAGRIRDALAEHDAILAGRARRKDKARALYDGAKLLVRAGDAHAADQRLRRACADYKDVSSVRGKALLLRADLLRKSGRVAEAAKLYERVTEVCRFEEKLAIRAYDALALMAIEAGDEMRARRWLRVCVQRYRKRAARGDRFGAYLSRLLGEMKAPRRLGGG